MKSVSALSSIVATRARVWDYLELAKPRVVSLVLLSTAVGFFLASPRPINFSVLFHALFGTALVAAGAMALNQWMERDRDGLMARTENRPLPARRMQPSEALSFAVLLTAAGLAVLAGLQHSGAAMLAFLTLASYVFAYTPLKSKTSLCTIVGALPGALPTLIGWTAAAGRPSYEGWILFFILFLWQMPHFLAIAWIYREEYAAARFCMLSVSDPDGRCVARQILLYSLALLPVSLLPTLAGQTGLLYFLTALVLGAGFIALGATGLKRLDQNAPLLFRASLVYLTLLLVLMVVDKT